MSKPEFSATEYSYTIDQLIALKKSINNGRSISGAIESLNALGIIPDGQMSPHYLLYIWFPFGEKIQYENFDIEAHFRPKNEKFKPIVVTVEDK
jgi:hypothetical protein